MTLGTVDDTGMPAARIVLLKEATNAGFTFYTNTNSAKGRQLAHNPKAALCFYWMPLAKQVRVRGEVQPVTDAEADAYFATRPRESQIGAWASDQSTTLSSRGQLELQVKHFAKKFEGLQVSRPPHWSGYRVVPSEFEFWLRGDFRLHDRVLYERDGNSGWKTRRLNP
jgi:pyridoxamine 5'-phosphate oxidase